MCGRREGDIAACYADCTKAKNELNWTTKLDMTDACRDCWNWQSKYPFGFSSNHHNNNNDEVAAKDASKKSAKNGATEIEVHS